MPMTRTEILKRIQLRQSTIKDYLLCPLMFRYRHVERIEPSWRSSAAMHGTTLHKLIELIHRDKWNLRVEHHYREIFDSLEYDGEEAHIPVFWEDRDKELAAYEANAIEILDGYRRRHENQVAWVLYAEQPFRVKVAGHYFTGTIDQVRRNPDGSVELVDFKSNRQQPHPAYLANDWQMALYSYALRYGDLWVGGEWIRPRLMVDAAAWYHLRGHEIRKRRTVNGAAGEEKLADPVLRVRKSIEDLRGFREDVRRLLNVMLKDWHYPNPNACSFCGYREICAQRHQAIPVDLIEEARELLEDVA